MANTPFANGDGPGVYTYQVTKAGTYAFQVDGAQGGAASHGTGGLGAAVGGDIYLHAGAQLEIVVGGPGADSDNGAAGGGGGSFVIETYNGTSNVDIDEFIAGGGGGAGYYGGRAGGGQTASTGAHGGGAHGGAGGAPGQGGGGGQRYTYNSMFFAYHYGGGGGGGGFDGGAGSAYTSQNGQNGSGAPAPASIGAEAFRGGAGAGSYQAGAGGVGGGGGGGYYGGDGGGGGGGGDGGGGGGQLGQDGGGGGSYVTSTATDPTKVAATHPGNGLVTIADVACYCPGTLILTDRGEVAVERLEIGDRLVTGSGEAKPILWIGRRSYDGRFARGQRAILPVRIKAGAMGDGLPRRDFQVSPAHAMVVDGVLVPAGALVNGVSIVQAMEVASVHYIHVELEEHSVIYAEGAASESFLDDDSRGMFQNAHTFAELYPRAPRRPAVFCLPRVEGGEELEAIREAINARAGLQRRAPALSPLRGHLDLVTAGRIEGWAQAVDHPEAPVCLDILVDGQLAAQTLANRHRPDLEAAGLGSGRHAFSVALDLAPGGTVEVRRSLDRAVLASSEKVGQVLAAA